MNFLEYQKLARRTQNNQLSKEDKFRHAVFGMMAELGEVMNVSIYDKEKEIDEISDLYWFISEAADVMGIKLQVIAEEIEADRKIEYPAPLDELMERLSDDSQTRTVGIPVTMMLFVSDLAGKAQKQYQGHEVEHAFVREIIKLLMEELELYTSRLDISIPDVLDHNIAKLRKRYPNGFDAERSVHREEYEG